MSYPTGLDDPVALNHIVVNQAINDYDESSASAEAVIDASSAASRVTTNNQSMTQTFDLTNNPSIDQSSKQTIGQTSDSSSNPSINQPANQSDEQFVETDKLTNSTKHPLHVKLARDVMTIRRIDQSSKQSPKQSPKRWINQFNVHDLIGCSIKDLSLTLHFYIRKSSKHARTYQPIHLQSIDPSIVALWHHYFMRAARSLPLLNEPVPVRSIKLIVNPFSGTGSAPSKAAQITPLFEQGGIQCDTIVTTKSGHAFEIANKLPLDQSINQSIVSVSGDGLLYEILNGLMQRDDWVDAINQITFGVIAGGGGNGCARSICHVSDEVYDAVGQAFVIAKGYTRKMDMASINQSNNQSKPIFSLLSLAWAMISDIDLKSDNYRWMGSARFTAAALSIVMANKPHMATIEYLSSDDQSNNQSNNQSKSSSKKKPLPYSNVKPCTEQTRCSHCYRNEADSEIDALKEFLFTTNPSKKQSNDSDKHTEQPPVGQPSNQSNNQSNNQWMSLPDTPVRVLWAMNVPYAAADMLPAPLAHFSDGSLDLLLVRNCGRFALLDVMTSIENGTHLKHENVEYFKVRGLRVKPGSDCPYSVDGEAVKSSPIELKMWRGILNIHSK